MTIPSECIVTVTSEGTLLVLDNDAGECFKKLGIVKTRRASHVEPDNWFFRLAFHSLRRVYGDKGQMSEFTRKWPCLWRVNLGPVGGPILDARWEDRREAINAEVEWLNEHLGG